MHNDYTLLMSMMLDGEATAAEESAVREHLRMCGSCAAIWERWQAVDRRLAAAPLLAPAADLTDRVMARVQAQELRRRRLRWLGSGLFGMWLTISLVGLLTIGGLTYWSIQHPHAVSQAFFAVLQVVDGLSWIALDLWRFLSRLGAPTLAAGVGLLALLTCAFAMLWLWVMGRGRSALSYPMSAA
jgi:anti-sigma factor RsiW